MHCFKKKQQNLCDCHWFIKGYLLTALLEVIDGVYTVADDKQIFKFNSIQFNFIVKLA